MAWALVPQGKPSPSQVPARMQVIHSPNRKHKLLQVMLSRDLLLQAGLVAGDKVSLRLGEGPDTGWLRLDLTFNGGDGRALFEMARTTSAAVKFSLPHADGIETTETRQATDQIVKPGTIFIRAPEECAPLFTLPLQPTDSAAGLVPLHGTGKVEPQQPLLAPPATVAVVEPAPTPPAPAAPSTTAARVPVGKETPDQLKPEAMAMFAAGQSARDVHDQLGIPLSLASRWVEEFRMSRPGKRRAA